MLPWQIFSLVGIYWFILCVVHSLRYSGLTKTTLFFVPCSLYAFILENFNMRLSGSYHYDPVFVMIDLTPIAIILFWGAVVYTVYQLTRWESNIWKRGLYAGLIAMGLDLIVDPVATYYGLWVWTSKTASVTSSFLGVPIMNFVSWVLVVWIFITGYEYINKRWVGQRRTVAHVLSPLVYYTILVLLILVSYILVAVAASTSQSL